MQLDAFVFKMLILAIPGFLSYTIYKKVAIYRREQKMLFGFPEIFLVIIYSLVCCAVYDIGALIISHFSKKEIATTFSRLVTINDKTGTMYSAVELLVFCLIGVAAGFIASRIETKRLINRFAKFIRISQHDGDIDVWSAFCSIGRLLKYSDPGETREILLADVNVYDEIGNFCYNSPVVYLSRQADDFALELPQNPQTEKHKNET
ncbi:MAG: hypothetical protein LBG76_01220 [Treponema sp.]|jgi:hypothetical protein|nr:hypothetical protein [Treponema sp.]